MICAPVSGNTFSRTVVRTGPSTVKGDLLGDRIVAYSSLVKAPGYTAIGFGLAGAVNKT